MSVPYQSLTRQLDYHSFSSTHATSQTSSPTLVMSISYNPLPPSNKTSTMMELLFESEEYFIPGLIYSCWLHGCQCEAKIECHGCNHLYCASHIKWDLLPETPSVAGNLKGHSFLFCDNCRSIVHTPKK